MTSSRTSSTSSRCSSSIRTGAARAGRWRPRRRARTTASSTYSFLARRCANCSRTASCRRRSSRVPRSLPFSPATTRLPRTANCNASRRPSSRFRPKGVSAVTRQFSLAGLLVGVLVGLTGMGGGSLMTPILIILFGFDAKVAVGTDILHGAIFKSFGAVRYRQLGTVHARLASWMFLGSGPMSLAGVAVASALGDKAQNAENYAVGAALVLGGLGLVAKTFVKRGVQPSNAPFLL